MKILLNLIPIKSGGGQQVALNFLNILLDKKFQDIEFLIIATKGTKIGDFCSKQSTCPSLLIRNDILTRFIFENFTISEVLKSHKIDVIYTLFGPPIIYKPCISIAGMAYSNLFFPEILFWKGSPLFKFKHFLIDRYRLKKALKADALIFENISMLNRARTLYNYDSSIFIPPSISGNQNKSSTKVDNHLNKINKNKFNILLLAGWHPNKKIDAIPEVLHQLTKLSEDNVNFIISVEANDVRSKDLMKEAKKKNVSDNIVFIGKIAPTDVKFIVEEVDSLILISLLESFSNNIIEAWSYHRPLIITDAEWSRSICKSAAVYVNRDSPKDIAEKIKLLKNDASYYNSIVKKGIEEMKEYPTPEEKVIRQLSFIQSIYEKNN